ncbi:uncharacterized protein LOC111869108 isoform X3 [Cryptotermes secundus]|uniref:uncharacterized protein LOC111869108 isoform X3 n=1 Tax=Cryptotermes secundus TaxID=105785 RepID=UPI001454C892|nr:uncharacterized protein LOC111869108 isoform X3 [Cryptotermes secundus]
MARSTGNLPGCLVNMYYQESSVPKWFICTAVLHGLPTSYLCPEEANIKASKVTNVRLMGEDEKELSLGFLIMEFELLLMDRGWKVSMNEQLGTVHVLPRLG